MTMELPRFRAWHKTIKRMFPVRTFVYPSTGFEGRVILSATPRIACGFGGVELMMEFPGWDKNGRRLHEGDLLLENDQKTPMKLAYKPGVGWELVDPDDPLNPEKGNFILPEDGHFFTLVGNVFEGAALSNKPTGPGCSECGNKIVARGLCGKHYQQMWKHGNLTTRLVDRDRTRGCDTPGCTREHYAKGLCGRCYWRSYRLAKSVT